MAQALSPVRRPWIIVPVRPFQPPWFRVPLRFIESAAFIGLFVFAGRGAGINPTTAALGFLLIVLAIATRWGLAEALFTSVVAVIAFNYFFLPPIGGLTIADPQNWIALFAFFVTAITASQLSARARRKMEETRESRNELARLYELSRAFLMHESGDAVHESIVAISRIFGARNTAFFDAGANRTDAVTGGAPAPDVDLARVAQTGEPLISGEYRILPVQLGTHLVGSLAMDAEGLSPATCDSLANLIAINYERAAALHRAATAEVARRNEEFKSSLLDGLAHDLKTPLTAIRTCVTRLIDFPPRTEDVRNELLAIIDQESSRLQRSISEAVELARIESSALHLNREPARVREIVESALAETRDEDSARYSFTGAGEAVMDADPDLLRRALVQILENARKYSSPGAPIEIAARSQDSRLTLTVRDHGPGFAPDELSHVFDKFYRGRSGRSREGTGMGLAIARGIIEAHGGTIHACNQPGGGASVSITIPAMAHS